MGEAIVAEFVAAISGLFSGVSVGLVDMFGTLIWDPTLNTGAGGLTSVAIWGIVGMAMSLVVSVLFLALRKVF